MVGEPANFFFQAEDGIRDVAVTGVQTCALPICCEFTNYCEGLDQRHKQVTCKLWDRKLDPTEPAVRLASDGKRRILPPSWAPPSGSCRGGLGTVDGKRRTIFSWRTSYTISSTGPTTATVDGRDT